VVNRVKGDDSCYAKAAKSGLPVDVNCLLKAANKYDQTVAMVAKGCMTKLDAKALAVGSTQPCLSLLDATAINAKIQPVLTALRTQLYVNPPPNGINLCYAGQTKCINNYVKAIIGCYQKAVKTGLPVDGNCLALKGVAKFSGATGCMTKLDAPTKACTTSGLSGQAGSVQSQLDSFLNDIRAELMPDKVFEITTVAGAGLCGEVSSPAGSLLNLNCGELSIGGGAGSVPPGATPPGTATRFPVLGSTVDGAPLSWGQRRCSALNCFFGSPLPISNGALSTCVVNTFTADASGTVTAGAGSFTGTIPLQSTVTVTSNDTQPCPLCVAGFCDATAANSGAACVVGATTGQSHDCVASGPALSPFAVNLAGITTGTSTLSSATGIFCPGVGQTSAGAFGQPEAEDIEVNGSTATPPLNSTPKAATLASAFCIPATGNGLIDGSADLPGPGATSLPVLSTLQ
jgi:hypothetical protein